MENIQQTNTVFSLAKVTYCTHWRAHVLKHHVGGGSSYQGEMSSADTQFFGVTSVLLMTRATEVFYVLHPFLSCKYLGW